MYDTATKMKNYRNKVDDEMTILIHNKLREKNRKYKETMESLSFDQIGHRRMFYR